MIVKDRTMIWEINQSWLIDFCVNPHLLSHFFLVTGSDLLFHPTMVYIMISITLSCQSLTSLWWIITGLLIKDRKKNVNISFLILRIDFFVLFCLLVSKDSSSINRVKIENNHYKMPEIIDRPNYAPYSFRFAGKRSSTNKNYNYIE